MTLLSRWLPFDAPDADDEGLRSLERRAAALDATIGAQQAQRARAREDYARLEMLGMNRQMLEERIEAEIQGRRRAGKEGDRAGAD